jgi:hypothetical protein
MRGPNLDLKATILDRMAQTSSGVWTPTDFVDLGPRQAVDQALHRLAATKAIRRIARGLYDRSQFNKLTGKETVADYRAVTDAVARRDQVRMLVDGITAANDLGLTDAVPGRVVVFSDARLKPIRLGNLAIEFKYAAPSRLYWAGHPAMRIVQALYWLRDQMTPNRDRAALMKRLTAILDDPKHGAAMRDDLRDGLSTLPEWMQAIVRDLLMPQADGQGGGNDGGGSDKGSGKVIAQQGKRIESDGGADHASQAKRTKVGARR